jgi:three-Cys-motif partner protein
VPDNTDSFFKERQPAAVLKHGILRRYLQPFASKTGKFAADNRVVYLDAYAGPGTYSDGTSGSPALAEQTATAIASFRNLECIYVEKDRSLHDDLRAMLQPFDNWSTYNASIDACLDEVLEQVGDAPLLAFLDPFGLPPLFDDLTSKVLRRPRALKTEVLLNFSTPGLHRNAGHLTSKKRYAAKAALVEGMDARLGGDWWQKLWEDHGSPERYELIRDEYVRRLVGAGGGGWGWWVIPVSNRPDGSPVYHLVFLTRHRDGLWMFNEAISAALEEYHDFCHRGQLDLDPIAERELRWKREIRANIERLLKSGGFIVQDRLDEVCGEALGYAREKHIRAAIKELYREGQTSTNGVGKVQRMRVEPL